MNATFWYNWIISLYFTRLTIYNKCLVLFPKNTCTSSNMLHFFIISLCGSVSTTTKHTPRCYSSSYSTYAAMSFFFSNCLPSCYSSPKSTYAAITLKRHTRWNITYLHNQLTWQYFQHKMPTYMLHFQLLECLLGLCLEVQCGTS